MIDLIPERLQDFSNVDAVGVTSMHQTRDVREADITCEQLFMIEGTHAALPEQRVPVEREIDFFDAMTFRARAEFRFRPRRAAAEKYAV